MTKELADVIIKCLELDEVDAEINEGYSGRCMYGRATTAITGDFTITQVLSSVIEHAELFVEEGESTFCGEELRQDQFGMGYVIY